MSLEGKMGCGWQKKVMQPVPDQKKGCGNIRHLRKQAGRPQSPPSSCRASDERRDISSWHVPRNGGVGIGAPLRTFEQVYLSSIGTVHARKLLPTSAYHLRYELPALCGGLAMRSIFECVSGPDRLVHLARLWEKSGHACRCDLHQAPARTEVGRQSLIFG